MTEKERQGSATDSSLCVCAVCAQAKEELIESDLYSSVFMSGSGSTMVCLGSHALDEAPRFEEESNDDWLAVMTQPVSRQKGSGEWYVHLSTPFSLQLSLSFSVNEVT